MAWNFFAHSIQDCLGFGVFLSGSFKAAGNKKNKRKY